MSPADCGDVAVPTVTVTSTGPAAPAGEVALHEVVNAQVTPVAAASPKSTVVAPAVVENPDPVMVTGVPPAGGPLVGLTDVTAKATVP